jgi:hypothetical protein
MCGEIQSQNMSTICDLNWMLESELGETSACLSDFVDATLKLLGDHGIHLCEFGSQLMECLLVTLLTNAGSLQLCVRAKFAGNVCAKLTNIAVATQNCRCAR